MDFPFEESTHCPLFSQTFSYIRTGCHGTNVVKAAFVCLSTDPSVSRGSSQRNLFLTGRVWFSDKIFFLEGFPWEIPSRRDILSQTVTPGPSYWSCGSGNWRGPACIFWSLNRFWMLELPPQGNFMPWSGLSLYPCVYKNVLIQYTAWLVLFWNFCRSAFQQTYGGNGSKINLGFLCFWETLPRSMVLEFGDILLCPPFFSCSN